MLKRIEELESKLSYIEESLKMVDDYSKHFMTQTLTIIAIVIAIAGVTIVGATYFMIKSVINQKMDSEVEKRILKVLGKQPPVFYAKGEDLPNANGEIILAKSISGINDLEPNTLLILDAKTEKTTMGQLGSSLKYHLIINSQGERVISFENYCYSDEPNSGNGRVTWALVWLRKYSN